MKNVFYLMLKVLFVLDIFTFLCWHFGYAEKRVYKKAMVDSKICDVTDFFNEALYKVKTSGQHLRSLDLNLDIQ